MNIEEYISRIRQIKDEAKNYKAGGNLAAAAGRLREGIAIGREAVAVIDQASSEASGTELAWELADCLGMLGGVLLKQNLLNDAIEAFEQGHEIEKQGHYQLGLTYSTVNYMVARVIQSGAAALPSQAALAEVIEVLKVKSATTEKDNQWAWADLGMCELIRGNMTASRDAYVRAASLATADEKKTMLAWLDMVKTKLTLSVQEAEDYFNRISEILS